MAKTSVFCQLLLVACCVSVVVVSAMPQRSAKSRGEDSDESCEDNSCSSRNRDSSSKHRESTTKKPSSVEAGRTRRPSSIDAGPVKHQETGITSIKTPDSVDQVDPSTGGEACETCTGIDPAAVGGTTNKMGDASIDPLTGETCTTCTGVDTGAGGTLGTTGTGGATGTTVKIPIIKPSLGEAGRIRIPGSSNLADPASTGATCTTCTATGTATGTTIQTGDGSTDPSTGAGCTTCTGVNPAKVTAGTIGETKATATGTIPTRKPIFGEGGRIRIPGSVADPSSAGTACTTCTAPGTTAGTVDTTGTTGKIPFKKPSLGEAGRIKNPGSANLADPSTGASCATCTGKDTAPGTAAETVGTTGTTPVRKPSLAESGRIRIPGSVNKPDLSTTGTACTNCTATGTSVKETSPVKKPITLIDPARIRRPGTSTLPAGSLVNTTCVTCTTPDTTATSLGESAVGDVVKKQVDPATDSGSDPSTEGVTLSRFNTTVVETVDHIHFNYDDPNKWKEHNSLCKGAHQSPINIETRNTIVSSYPDILFFNYDKSYPENLENNGHTVQLSIDKLIKDLPYITGGGLDGLYQFAQLHFHWGEGLLGSEHTIDGKQYVAEAHIVHWDMKYGSFINATKHNDGLHVLGILIELQARDNIAFRHLEQFEKLTEAGCAKTDQLSYSVPLADLLPDSTSSFYRYAGSLTDARCNEDVIWTVFDTPIAISERQLAKFRLLTDEHGRLLTKNVRPTQLSHKRTVIYNPPSSPVV